MDISNAILELRKRGIDACHVGGDVFAVQSPHKSIIRCMNSAEVIELENRLYKLECLEEV